MVNAKERDEIIANFVDLVEKNMELNVSNKEMQRLMDAKAAESCREYTKKVRANVLAALPVDHQVRKSSLYVNFYDSKDESKFDSMKVTVTNSVTDPRPFSFTTRIPYVNVADTLGEFFKSVYVELLKDSMIVENLEVVNETLKEICKQAEVGYEVSVVSPFEYAGKKIAYMSDTEVQLVADMDRVFDLEDLLVLHEINEEEGITEEAVKGAMKAEVDEMAKCQTPEQFIAENCKNLVQYVCDVSKLTRPITYIRKITNKNIKINRAKNDAIMFFEEDGVFSLVERRDGNLAVLLSPFDITTYRKVDYDVLSKLA